MKFFIQDHTGHTTHEFTEAQKSEADALFAKLVGDDGKRASTRKAGEIDYRIIKTPGQVQDETLFLPHLVGG